MNVVSVAQFWILGLPPFREHTIFFDNFIFIFEVLNNKNQKAGEKNLEQAVPLPSTSR